MKKAEKCYICGQEIQNEEWEPYLVWEGDPHNDPDAEYHEEKVEIVVVSFPGRHTRRGAYTKYRIFSLRQKKELKPHRTESSITGRHWDDFWYLLSGKYFVSWEDISNSGRHHCGYGLLIVEEGKYRIEKWKGRFQSSQRFVSASKKVWEWLRESGSL